MLISVASGATVGYTHNPRRPDYYTNRNTKFRTIEEQFYE